MQLEEFLALLTCPNDGFLAHVVEGRYGSRGEAMICYDGLEFGNGTLAELLAASFMVLSDGLLRA